MTFYQPQQILVTGGAGFIGANYIHYMAEKYPECTLVNLDALTYAGSLSYLSDLKHRNYHFIKGNICDRELIDRCLREYNIDTLVHFAAESHVDRSINGPDAFIQSNVVGTFTLLEASRHYIAEQHRNAQNFRFHHVSTDEVFGSLQESDPQTLETDPYRPNSPYSASKASSDHLVRAYFHTYALPCTLSHCSNNFGPFQHQEKFIPTVIQSCLQNKAIPVYGNGKNTRDWLYVTDHCAGIDTIIQKGALGEAYNIGANNELSNLELAHTLCALMDKRNNDFAPHAQLIRFVTDRPGHDWRYGLNAEKIRKLGWRPSVSFEEGLKKTIDYFS